MDHQDNLLGVLKTLFQWKKPILICCIVAGLGSIIISLMLSNYYQSKTIFYAASPELAVPEPVGNPLKERQYFGGEPDTDRLIAIAQSGELVNFLIQKFNLFEHYEIDSTQEKAAHKVQLRFLKLYNVKKTKYEGIELSMEDTDKQLAANIVNAARMKVDALAQRLIKDSQVKQISSFEANIKQKEKDILFFGDSLARVRDQFGIYNTNSQGEILAGLQARTKAKLVRNRAKLALLKTTAGVPKDSILALRVNIKGGEAELGDIEKRISLFTRGLAKVKVLEDILEEAGDQISLDRERYKQLRVAYENEIPAIITLEEGEIPLVKSRPRRSIIVIAAVMLAFLFSVIAVLLIDTYRNVNWKDIIYGQ